MPQKQNQKARDKPGENIFNVYHRRADISNRGEASTHMEEKEQKLNKKNGQKIWTDNSQQEDIKNSP